MPAALILPTESPTSSLDVKRALLGFERVLLQHPEDRDLIPAHTLMAARGLPMMSMNMGPVRPLGKLPGYDDNVEFVLTEAKAAVDNGIVELIPAPEEFSGLAIGGSPVDLSRYANPVEVLGLYEFFAQEQTWVDLAAADLDIAQVLANPGDLAKKGAEESRVTLHVDGKSAGETPMKLLVGRSELGDEELLHVTRAAHSRLGALIKGLAQATVENATPLSFSSAYSHTLEQFSNSFMSRAWEVADLSDDRILSHYVRRAHRVIVDSHVDARALESMTFDELLHLRGKAWGEALGHRARFLDIVKEIALEVESDGEFERRIQSELDQFNSSTGDWQHDAKKLGVRFGLRVISLPALAASMSQLMLAASNPVMALIAIGVAAREVAGHTDDFFDLNRDRGQTNASSGYALAKPYSPFH